MTKTERNPKSENERPVFLNFGLRLSFVILVASFAGAAEPNRTNDYSAVDAIFSQRCLDCHASKDPEGQLVLESYESLMKGGELGAAIIPTNSADSLLVRMIEGRFEKGGKKKIMPPGKRQKLSSSEIALIRNWIDTGALPPAQPLALKEIVTPKVTPKVAPRRAIQALAWSPAAGLLAVGRHAEVELCSPTNLHSLKTLSGQRGAVNGVAFSADGASLFAAGGEPGIAGKICQWKVADGSVVWAVDGHKDAIYALALSPDGKMLATGSYDQKIKLWDVSSGKELRTLSGHNGCIYGLAFRPDGKILASASADRTVKLWDVASGERRDTLSQSLKEVYAVAFSHDGARLLAGGADNRIRIWQISDAATETTDPLLLSKFAHEGAILNLVLSTDDSTLLSSADDQTVKVWEARLEAANLKERLLFDKQPDWAPALACPDAKHAVVGRLDGSLEMYDVGSGRPIVSVSANGTCSTVADATPVNNGSPSKN